MLDRLIRELEEEMPESSVINAGLFEGLILDLQNEEHKLKFNMSDIIAVEYAEGDDVGIPETLAKAVECGATCCLIGFAMVRIGGYEDCGLLIQGLPEGSGIISQPLNFHGISSFNISRLSLGLTEDQAGILFHRSRWPNEYKDLADQEGERAAAIAIMQRIIRENSAKFLLADCEI